MLNKMKEISRIKHETFNVKNVFQVRDLLSTVATLVVSLATAVYLCWLRRTVGLCEMPVIMLAKCSSF